MNCQPGDVARVISIEETRLCGYADRFVKVVRLAPTMLYGEFGWVIEEPFVCGCGCGVEIYGLADSILRPIRDPGDDAKDELLRPLPEEVPA